MKHVIHFRAYAERPWRSARSLCNAERYIIKIGATSSPNKSKVTCPDCLKLMEVQP